MPSAQSRLFLVRLMSPRGDRELRAHVLAPLGPEQARRRAVAALLQEEPAFQVKEVDVCELPLVPLDELPPDTLVTFEDL
jgi:hypothetical protein